MEKKSEAKKIVVFLILMLVVAAVVAAIFAYASYKKRAGYCLKYQCRVEALISEVRLGFKTQPNRNILCSHIYPPTNWKK